MAAKPEFIFVPGAWHGPEAFAPTTTLLTAAGYTVHGVNLPSVGPVKHLESFDPDVVEIRNTINSVLSKGKDVVMLYHSYGGVPGSEALGEYIKDLESGKGKEGWGRVRRLVYCASFVLPEGGSLMAALQGKPLPWFILDVPDEVRPENPGQVFYNDIAPERAAPYIAGLKPHSYRTFSSQQTVMPCKAIPSTYILCESDLAIPLPGQEGMVATAQQMGGKFDVIEKCSASHSPFLSQPKLLTEFLIKAAA